MFLQRIAETLKKGSKEPMNTFFLVTQPIHNPDIIMYVHRTEKKSVGLRGWCKSIWNAVHKDDWWALVGRSKVCAMFETAYYEDPTKDKYFIHVCHTCEDCMHCLPITKEQIRLLCTAHDRYMTIRLTCLNGFVPKDNCEFPFMKQSVLNGGEWE